MRIPQRRLNGRFFHILVFLTALVWVSLDVSYTIVLCRIHLWLFVGIAFLEHDGGSLPGGASASCQTASQKSYSGLSS